MTDFDALQVFTLGAFFGLLVGARAGWGLAWLLPRPLPRPWRPVAGAYRDLWRDTVRRLATVDLTYVARVCRDRTALVAVPERLDGISHRLPE